VTKAAWLKVAMGAATVGAAVIGGLAGGPLVAAGSGLTTLVGVLGGLYHDPPPPRPPRKDARGQIADPEDPSR
jgi:hypothetical protein